MGIPQYSRLIVAKRHLVLLGDEISWATSNATFPSGSLYFEGYGRVMKLFLLILGILAAVLIVLQLVMGVLILQGQASMRTAHQHSGYLTVAVTLVYIGWSLA